MVNKAIDDRFTTQKSTGSGGSGTPDADSRGCRRFKCWSSTANVTAWRMGFVGYGSRDGIV